MNLVTKFAGFATVDAFGSSKSMPAMSLTIGVREGADEGVDAEKDISSSAAPSSSVAIVIEIKLDKRLGGTSSIVGGGMRVASETATIALVRPSSLSCPKTS